MQGSLLRADTAKYERFYLGGERFLTRCRLTPLPQGLVCRYTIMLTTREELEIVRSELGHLTLARMTSSSQALGALHRQLCQREERLIRVLASERPRGRD
jgi:hypothetical protein